MFCQSVSNALSSSTCGRHILLLKPYLSLSPSVHASSFSWRKWKAFHRIRFITSCVLSINCFLYSFIEGMGMFFSEYPMLIGLNGVSIRCLKVGWEGRKVLHTSSDNRALNGSPILFIQFQPAFSKPLFIPAVPYYRGSLCACVPLILCLFTGSGIYSLSFFIFPLDARFD